MIEKLKVIKELKDFALENNEEEIDWSNKEQIKYYIAPSDNKFLGWIHTYTCKALPFDVYFTSEKTLADAIEKVGKERIMKYYFSINEKGK